MSTKQYYQTEVFDHEAGTDLTFSVVPRHFLSADYSRASAGEVATLFAHARPHFGTHQVPPTDELEQLIHVFPSGSDGVEEAMSRLLELTDLWLAGPPGHRAERTAYRIHYESGDYRYRQTASTLTREPFVPVERSPITKESLISIASGALGGTASVALVSVLAASGRPLLILTSAAGIILIRVSTGIGRGLERVVEDQIVELLGVRPRKRKPGRKNS